MRPFQQQLVWSAFAIGCYVAPYLVPALAHATLLPQLATFIIGKVWFFTPHEAAERKKRESEAG